jgi:hypothetical protein
VSFNLLYTNKSTASISRSVNRGPVVQVSIFVVMIERVVVALPNVCLWVDVVLVHVVVHADIGKEIGQLLVVVIGNGSEGIENVRINWLQLWHAGPLALLLSSSS